VSRAAVAPALRPCACGPASCGACGLPACALRAAAYGGRRPALRGCALGGRLTGAAAPASCVPASAPRPRGGKRRAEPPRVEGGGRGRGTEGGRADRGPATAAPREEGRAGCGASRERACGGGLGVGASERGIERALVLLFGGLLFWAKSEEVLLNFLGHD